MIWRWRRYLGLKYEEMRQAQDLVWRNLAATDGDMIELQTFGFDRARFLEFLTGVIKWRAKSEYLPEHFEVVKQWHRYQPADRYRVDEIGEMVDDFIVTQLVDKDASGGIRARGMRTLVRREQQELLNGLERIHQSMSDKSERLVALTDLRPGKVEDVYGMLCTILDLEIVSRFAVRTPRARLVLAKMRWGYPVSREEVGELRGFVKSVRLVAD